MGAVFASGSILNQACRVIMGSSKVSPNRLGKGLATVTDLDSTALTCFYKDSLRDH